MFFVCFVFMYVLWRTADRFFVYPWGIRSIFYQSSSKAEREPSQFYSWGGVCFVLLLGRQGWVDKDHIPGIRLGSPPPSGSR